jgi:glucose/mannose transport system permease protein
LALTYWGMIVSYLLLNIPLASVLMGTFFTQVWNEFFLALSLSAPNTQTVQVVMAEAKGTTLVLYNLQMAAAMITTAIPLLFFLFLGRYFIRGILAGALKG